MEIYGWEEIYRKEKMIKENYCENMMKCLEPSTKYINITNEIRKEESEKLIDKNKLKRDENWSALGHQVFGAEVFN